MRGDLRLPVHYNGQDYFTSQYFHRKYQEGAGLKGKYQRHTHFVRLLQSIEAYSLYSEQGDIVELRWAHVKTRLPQIMRQALEPLFRLRGYQELVSDHGVC